MPQLIDLSHEIEHGMTTYPGLDAPVISDVLGRAASRKVYEGRAEFHIARIDMVANTGTYLDAPSHRFEWAADISGLPLEAIAFVPGVVVRLEERALAAETVKNIDLNKRALLIHTGWSRHWRTANYGAADAPYVSREAAEYLAQSGVTLVGIDSVNIDNRADLSRPAHTILLRSGIPVVEHLTNLEALGDRPFTFFAVPARVRGMGTFPVRAFAAV